MVCTLRFIYKNNVYKNIRLKFMKIEEHFKNILRLIFSKSKNIEAKNPGLANYLIHRGENWVHFVWICNMIGHTQQKSNIDLEN